MKESQLRDLNRKLQDVARAHFSFSQAATLMAHVNEHLSALAYAEEINERAKHDCTHDVPLGGMHLSDPDSFKGPKGPKD